MRYRPEIDGLRAVAVVAVVMFHGQFALGGVDPFRGGYVGVDVFFVISGYLITSLLLNDLREGRLSITHFYERRARRILPALLTVMLVSLPFAWALMLPKAVKEYAGSLLASLAFGSNIWFWLEDSYWAEPSEQKPFLHTWSLSVEEQFYVIFPLLLLMLWKLGSRYVLPLFLLGFLVSLLVAEVTSASHPEAAFFLPFARGWELLAGAVLAKLEADRGRSSSKAFEISMPSLGLLLVCASFFLFDGDTRHPSLLTLMPVAGTMLLIWFCSGREPVTKLLSSRPFVSIGLVSYSFYLWHFPVFAFARMSGSDPTQLDKAGWVLLSLLLSVVSYILVERPFRNRSLMPTRAFFSTVTAAVAAVAVVSGLAFTNDGRWGRYTSDQLAILGFIEDRAAVAKYVSEYSNTTLNLDFVDGDERNDLFVIGDSYYGDLMNALKAGAFLEGIEVSSHKISADCQNVPSTADYEQHIPARSIAKCAGQLRVGHPSLNERLAQAELIMVASSWKKYSTSQLDELVATLESLSDAPVLIVGRKWFARPTAKLARLSKQELIRERVTNDGHLALLRAVPEGIEDSYLDVHGLMCGNEDSCPIATPDGFLISYDGGHLTREGAARLGRLLREDARFMEIWAGAFGRGPHLSGAEG